jgi:hypothetical protein
MRKERESRRRNRNELIGSNPKVTKGHRKWKKAERSLKKVEYSREKKEKFDEGR